MEIMNIPSQKKCFELIEQMNMMSHIIDHSIKVANVAYSLSKKLKHRFPQIDINLATYSALLHDITKTRSFDTKENHSATGCEVVLSSIRNHTFMSRIRIYIMKYKCNILIMIRIFFFNR